MKNHRALLLLLIVPALAVASCRSRTDRSEGNVLLLIRGFNTIPFSVSLSNSASFRIDNITLANLPKDPVGAVSNLQDIELSSYEVTYRRRDTGTRVPQPMVQRVLGTIPVGSTNSLGNVPFLFSEQLVTQPFKDMLDFGVDRETGTAVIVLDVAIRFFGRTLSGDDLASEPARFTIEVRP